MQQSSATLSLSLYHHPCERTPVRVSHLSGALWESARRPALGSLTLPLSLTGTLMLSSQMENKTIYSL